MRQYKNDFLFFVYPQDQYKNNIGGAPILSDHRTDDNRTDGGIPQHRTAKLSSICLTKSISKWLRLRRNMRSARNKELPGIGAAICSGR
jgi:hypothetical protein